MPSRLLLIGLDAVAWKILHPLIDSGGMPTFSRLLEHGASGELLAVQPLLPALLHTSLVTGKRAWQHGVCHPAELIPGGRRMTASTAARRSARPLWEILAREGRRCVVAGWPATHGETTAGSILVSDRYPEPTAGPGIKPWPPAPVGTYYPPHVGNLLDGKRVSPEDIDANVIAQYIPEWKKVDQKQDRRIGQLRLFLAADYSYQTAALELLGANKWDFAAVRLPALAPIMRSFLPYHLHPQVGGDGDHVVYQNVVRAACRILDEMVRQQIQQAGPDTTVIVVSAHGVCTQGVPRTGFPPNDKDSWKSPYGIFIACGPKFAPDALVHGASVLDVVPTILTWYGLPLGEDMEGRSLLESFTSTPEITRISSWETRWEKSQTAETWPATDDSTIMGWRRERDWNFVQSCLDASRFEKALPVLDRLFRGFPERIEVAHALFQCQLALGLVTEAAGTLEVALESIPPGVATLLPRAELALAQRDYRLARSLVNEAYQLNPRNPMAVRKMGLLLLRLREWTSLADVARQALAANEHDAIAWLGLAAAQLRLGKAVDAAEAAIRAIRLKYFLPDAHFILARALVARGQWPEARQAMETYLKLQPNNRAAVAYFKRMNSDGKNGQPTS
jgi:predicted AlkP superfamily phosphohydrolase/phosphomutase/Flp pilus assembly protein TadD